MSFLEFRNRLLMVLEGALNGDIFKEYIEKFLIPTLSPKDTVIMDNLSSHKVEVVRKLIKAAGCKLIYVPPYSPDLNLAEPMWYKIKASLEKIEARTSRTLFNAIGQAFKSITVSNITGLFAIPILSTKTI